MYIPFVIYFISGINVTAKAGEVGAVSISSPGSSVRKEKEVQKIARVQTGVKSEFKP